MAKKMDPEGLSQHSAIDEDDVEGHAANKVRNAPEGATHKASAIEDDVEGHKQVKSAKRSAVDEDDVEGHAKVKSAKRSAVDDDDVEGHNFGLMSEVLARDLAKSKNRDIQRSASRNNLVSEAKRGTTRKP